MVNVANVAGEVNFIISATDISKAAIDSATTGVKKLGDVTEQQTARMKSHMEAYRKHWLMVTAGITAAIIAMQKAWDLAKIGAEYEEQRGILENLAQKYGTTADEIVSSMQTASDDLIAKSDLMQIALAGIAKGLKPDQLIELAGAAEILGDAVGMNATTALKELTDALESGRTKGLKTYLGTTLDLTTAFDGLDSKMTAAEKTQAMYLITVMAAKEMQEQQTKVVDETSDKMEKLEASYKNRLLAKMYG